MFYIHGLTHVKSIQASQEIIRTTLNKLNNFLEFRHNHIFYFNFGMWKFSTIRSKTYCLLAPKVSRLPTFLNVSDRFKIVIKQKQSLNVHQNGHGTFMKKVRNVERPNTFTLNMINGPKRLQNHFHVSKLKLFLWPFYDTCWSLFLGIICWKRKGSSRVILRS